MYIASYDSRQPRTAEYPAEYLMHRRTGKAFMILSQATVPNSRRYEAVIDRNIGHLTWKILMVFMFYPSNHDVHLNKTWRKTFDAIPIHLEFHCDTVHEEQKDDCRRSGTLYKTSC